jgi:cobalt-zinc-cadmium efflux system membrane fusion protein
LALSKEAASEAVPASLVGATTPGALAGTTGKTLAPAVITLARGAFPMVSIKAATATIIVTLTALGAAQVSRSTGDRTGEARAVASSEPQVAAPALPPAIELQGRTTYDPDTLTWVRPKYTAIVEKTFVAVGRRVKKGDPLIELYSTDLASAKSDFQTKYVQWRHDRKLYELRDKLVQTGAISQQLWVDTQNDEMKSRLDYNLALDKLQVYEVPKEEIDRLESAFESRGDDRKPRPNVADKARVTLVARADSLVAECNAVPGNFYDAKAGLLVLVPIDRLCVLAHLPERFQDRVKVGQPVEVESAFLEEKIQGTLEKIDVGGFTVRDTVNIRATIPNPGERLRADMLVRLRIMVP